MLLKNAIAKQEGQYWTILQNPQITFTENVIFTSHGQNSTVNWQNNVFKNLSSHNICTWQLWYVKVRKRLLLTNKVWLRYVDGYATKTLS